MNFLESDVLHLVSPVPYLQLAKRPSAERYIQRLATDATELEGILAQYPSVLYAPLEPHYALVRVLGVLNEELVEDLTLHYTWRGVVWAAWLAMLAPQRTYRRHLLAARSRAPRNQWLVDLALAEIEARMVDPDLQGNVRKLRRVLRLAPRPETKLRAAPTARQIEQLEREREKVRMAYRSGGSSGANRELAACPTLCTFRSV